MNRATFILAAAILLRATTFSSAQPAAEPAPGSRGNPANLPYIGGTDPNGNPVRLVKASGHISNYTESAVAPYALPDVLKLASGQPVKDADTWFKQRRPEILKLYENEIYGHVPETAPKVRWKVVETDPKARDGTAIMKRVVGHIGDKPDAPKINLTMYTPANAIGPVPMILCLNFNFGGRAPAIAIFDVAGAVLPKGWGYAQIYNTDIQPDTAAGLTAGVIGASFVPGQTKRLPNQWGSISAWAWGISRTIDYFETDRTVNSKQVAIQGTSRLGKTVLWASAEDPRIAATFTAVSGELGAALARRDWGETVDDMAQNFPWQFSGNLQKYVGHWNDMPVDQHMLIALSAPRPLFINGGLTDQWTDPVGEFLGAVAAGPVYRLLGKRDMGATEVPPLDHPLITGDIGFNYHHEGHAATPGDWQAFLQFLDKYFK